jgi:hypothetical protein
MIRKCAASLREARGRPRATKIRAGHLRAEKRRLLWLLFEHGFRRVPLAQLRDMAPHTLVAAIEDRDCREQE